MQEAKYAGLLVLILAVCEAIIGIYLQLVILLLMLCSLWSRVSTLWNDPNLHSWRIWASCCLHWWWLPLTCASGHVSIETKAVPQRMPWVTDISYSHAMEALCFPFIIRINLHPLTPTRTITIPYLTCGCSDISQKWPGGSLNFLNWTCGNSIPPLGSKTYRPAALKVVRTRKTRFTSVLGVMVWSHFTSTS